MKYMCAVIRRELVLVMDADSPQDAIRQVDEYYPNHDGIEIDDSVSPETETAKLIADVVIGEDYW